MKGVNLQCKQEYQIWQHFNNSAHQWNGLCLCHENKKYILYYYIATMWQMWIVGQSVWKTKSFQFTHSLFKRMYWSNGTQIDRHIASLLDNVFRSRIYSDSTCWAQLFHLHMCVSCCFECKASVYLIWFIYAHMVIDITSQGKRYQYTGKIYPAPYLCRA